MASISHKSQANVQLYREKGREYVVQKTEYAVQKTEYTEQSPFRPVPAAA